MTVGPKCRHNLYMPSTDTTTNTPGFNCRLQVFFTTNANGQRQAFRWSGRQMRAFRMPLLDAQLFVAQGQADKLAGHPMRAA